MQKDVSHCSGWSRWYSIQHLWPAWIGSTECRKLDVHEVTMEYYKQRVWRITMVGAAAVRRCTGMKDWNQKLWDTSVNSRNVDVATVLRVQAAEVRHSSDHRGTRGTSVEPKCYIRFVLGISNHVLHMYGGTSVPVRFVRGSWTKEFGERRQLGFRQDPRGLFLQ